MKKILCLALVLYGFQLNAQRYLTKSGEISFFSDAPLEKIEAHNKQVNCAIDLKTGDVIFKVLIRSFRFERALMQEHFNENYLLSDKFPIATFKGKIIDLDNIKNLNESPAEILVEGVLKIKGIEKTISTKSLFHKNDKSIIAKAEFEIQLKDFKIKIPGAVFNKISENILIKVNLNLKPLQPKIN
ncbi:MAG: hypothetical protein CL663_04510 [Bacteroidetes bacterium]|nr:hypothetical protein [Bacteroidota bacterium]